MSETPERKPDQKPIKCVLVAAGKYHDIDYARLEILKLLAEDDRIRVRVFEDYENLEAIKNADFLISYTCDLQPSVKAQENIRDFVARGGRYFALHGTNSVLRFLENGLVDAPDEMPVFADTLGTRFLAHPPIIPFTVDNAQPDHPLVKGIPSFETVDEQYLVETRAELDILLDTEYNGTDDISGFVDSDIKKSRHPVFYIRRMGEGAVLYLTMGHCRGHYDMEPVLDWWPEIDRSGWEQPIIYDLLRRGIGWSCETAISKF
ncbi:ThuA domain-containing protein [Parasphingorhabdus sp. JC815]|uniref:ThuA domain-containing protein n=1 Tax=Parasphingorhabdus sp. JC815 TaxID=3232140 RepID=UPI00345B1D60